MIGAAVVRTAGQPAQLRLTADRHQLAPTGIDLSYLLVEALDKDGNLCPLADNRVEFTVRGPAEIAGVGNGDPLSLEPFQANFRNLFFGKAMVILRSRPGETGRVEITAQSNGLVPHSEKIDVK